MGSVAESRQYVIRGGSAGRERLRLLSRVVRPSTVALLDRLGLRDGLACLDMGCGGGDVTLELARRVAPGGKAVGMDIDQTTLDLARLEAEQHGAANVEFRWTDAQGMPGAGEFDVVYARFLLTHLSDPVDMVKQFYRALRPGGVVAVEDVDFGADFVYPESKAFQRFHELYCAVVRRRGGDPNIGRRLPLLLKDCGFEQLAVCVAQPIALQGEVKLMNPVTMENIADAVVREGLAGREEIEQVTRELYAFAADENTVVGLPRIVQAWGRRPVA